MNDYDIAKLYIYKKENSEERNIEFTLTFSEFKRIVNRKTCYYSGIKLTGKNAQNKRIFTTHSIERINNQIGYTKENTVLCAGGFNKLKSYVEDPNISITGKHMERFLKTLLEMDN